MAHPIRALASRALQAINRIDELNGRPYVPTSLPAPSGRRRNWVHYGVMIPDLPEPHRTFGIMSIIGTPGVEIFANDYAIATTPQDTAYTVSATSSMTRDQFFVHSIASDCDIADDGSTVRLGHQLTLRGRYPEITVHRTHPDVDIALSITATPAVSHFANIPGIYHHWSALATYTGTIIQHRTPLEVAGLCTLEYANGIGIHSFHRNVRRTIPTQFFTYHVLNINDTTQVLFTTAIGPGGVCIHKSVYVRSLDDFGPAYHRSVEFSVTQYQADRLATPDGRHMKVPQALHWRATGEDGRTVVSIEGTDVADLTYGLGAGFVGNYHYTGTFRGAPVSGRAYLEYVDCRS